MMDTYYIYDLTINFKYHFIYCHIDNDNKCCNKKIIESCKMLYPLLRKYNHIIVSIISKIRSFNELNQPQSFVRENGYHMIELKNKLFIKELSYIDFYVKQYMMEYGMDYVRGGSYIDDFHISINNSSLQNEILFPLRFLLLNDILQETKEAIIEMDKKFIIHEKKIQFIQNKLNKYTSNCLEIKNNESFEIKCNDSILLLESMIYTDDIDDSIIHSLHTLLNINPKCTILHTVESLQSFSNQCRELYYIKSNYLSDIQFQIDVESKHCLELCEMLLFYYNTCLE